MVVTAHPFFSPNHSFIFPPTRKQTMSSEGEPVWVQIQKRTFTNWVNIQLIERDMRVDDLQTDFMDGVSLINLVELLSKGSVGPYSKRNSVASASQTTNARQFARNAQANIDIALKYLTEKQGIKLVNVSAYDFAEGNLRIILGVIWSLILKYQIQEGGDKNFKDYKVDLLAWVRSVIGPSTAYGLDITNFKGDWADGKALAALVDAFAWRSYEDWNDPAESIDRNTRAVTAAQEKLGIPGILAPKDVGLDDLSLLCYLDYFYDFAKKRPVTVRPAGTGYGRTLVDGKELGGGAGGAGGSGSPEPAWKIMQREMKAKYQNVRLTWH